MRKTRMGRKRLARNRKLMDWLYRRDNGAFYAKHPLTGKSVTIPTKDQNEARTIYAPIYARWLQDVLEAKAKHLADRIRVAESPAGGQSFAAFCADFREKVLPTLVKKNGQPLARKTWADYERMLRNQIEPAAAFASPIVSITTQTLRQYLSQWIGAPTYYNYMRTILTRVWVYAVDCGAVASNPMDGITKRPVGKRTAYVSNDDYVRILAQLDEFPARACDLLYLVSHNPVDVLNLQESQVTSGEREDPATGERRATVEIALKRNKTTVAVEIWDWADGDLATTVEWFRARKRAQKIVSQHLVVYGTDSRRRSIGTPVSVEYVSRRFAQAVVAAGLPKGSYTLRDLRPKGLTDEFLAAGDSDKGGHKTEAMKRHYRRVELPMLAKNNLHLLRQQDG